MGRIISYQPAETAPDLSKYTKIHDCVRLDGALTAVGTSRILKDIIGAGYLEQVILYCSVGRGGYVQVTVDGVIICKSIITNNGGIFNISNLTFDNNSYTNYYFAGVKAMYQQSAYSDSQAYFGEISPNNYTTKDMHISTPIFFSKSCKVEFISAWSDPLILIFDMMGAVKTS